MCAASVKSRAIALFAGGGQVRHTMRMIQISLTWLDEKTDGERRPSPVETMGALTVKR